MADMNYVELIERRSPACDVVLTCEHADEERDLRFSMSNAYHAAIDRLLTTDPARLILSLHSFTPVYEGTPRAVELGVLFDEEMELAEVFHAAFVDAGFAALLNEPYSGK